MSFLFDKLFQKQNPELASQMAKRGLIFDRIRHRWVRKPENRANPTTAPSDEDKPIPGWKPRDVPDDPPYEAPPIKMPQDELLNVWNQLNSGDTVKVWSEAVMSFGSPKWVEFKVGRKSASKKYDVERITLRSVNNPEGVKHFIYNRQGRISFASGDMATNLIAMKPSSDFVMPPPGIPKLRRGDKVQIPHKGKMVTGTIVRYDEGEQWEGQRVGSPFYVVDVGEYESVIVPKHNVQRTFDKSAASDSAIGSSKGEGTGHYSDKAIEQRKKDKKFWEEKNQEYLRNHPEKRGGR